MAAVNFQTIQNRLNPFQPATNNAPPTLGGGGATPPNGGPRAQDLTQVIQYLTWLANGAGEINIGAAATHQAAQNGGVPPNFHPQVYVHPIPVRFNSQWFMDVYCKTTTAAALGFNHVGHMQGNYDLVATAAGAFVPGAINYFFISCNWGRDIYGTPFEYITRVNHPAPGLPFQHAMTAAEINALKKDHENFTEPPHAMVVKIDATGAGPAQVEIYDPWSLQHWNPCYRLHPGHAPPRPLPISDAWYTNIVKEFIKELTRRPVNPIVINRLGTIGGGGQFGLFPGQAVASCLSYIRDELWRYLQTTAPPTNVVQPGSILFPRNVAPQQQIKLW